MKELDFRLLIVAVFLLPLAECRAPGPWHDSHCRPPTPKGARLSPRWACRVLKIDAVVKLAVSASSSWQFRQVSAPFSLYWVPGPTGSVGAAGVAADAAEAAAGALAAPWASASGCQARPAHTSSATIVGLMSFIAVASG